MQGVEIKLNYVWKALKVPNSMLHQQKFILSYSTGGRRGHDRMVFGFTTTVQSVPITTKVESLNPVHSEMYSLQH